MRQITVQIQRHVNTSYMFDLTVIRSQEDDINEILTGEGIKRVLSALVEQAIDTL